MSIFIPSVQFDHIAIWRRYRRNRCFEAWAKILIPDYRLRSRVGRLLRRHIPWARRFAYTELGMIFYDRIIMPKFTIDTIKLKKANDLRQILSDNPIMDMLHDSEGNLVPLYIKGERVN